MADGDITEGIILPPNEDEIRKREEERKRASNFAKEFQEGIIEENMNNEQRIQEETVGGKITFNSIAKKQYEKTYGLVGNHSGVQVCHWNKKSIKGHRGCYKVKFYGIDCHKCAQMSPALAWCTEACVFCWRPSEWMKKTTFGEQEVDDTDYILEETVRVRKKLISGLGGASGTDKQKFKEAFEEFPSHWAISLSGEPTIYPKLGALIKKLKINNKVKTVFLVTNGQEPQHLQKLAEEDALPTQLYVSLTAANEDMFKKINRSVYKDGWQRLNRTLELLSLLKCRKVIRFTIIKGVNDDASLICDYSHLLEKSKADFIEVKSYMALGFSRKRLGTGNVCSHEHIKKFTSELLKLLPAYNLSDDDEPSRIVLLKRKDSEYENIIKRPSEEARKLLENFSDKNNSSNCGCGNK